jgi:hypothetical protein
MRIVFRRLTNGVPALWLRPIGSLSAREISGTLVQLPNPNPLWSPDSRYIAFFDSSKLRRVAVMAGPSQVLCDVTEPFGLGAYEVTGLLGGMGEVYKARDTSLDRTVAIKFLQSADSYQQQRFEPKHTVALWARLDIFVVDVWRKLPAKAEIDADSRLRRCARLY